MNTAAHSAHPVTLLPAGFVALGLGGDQNVTEVHSRYTAGVVNTGPGSGSGGRQWLPNELADAARDAIAKGACSGCYSTGSHLISCPVAEALSCEGCGALGGEPCHPGCLGSVPDPELVTYAEGSYISGHCVTMYTEARGPILSLTVAARFSDGSPREYRVRIHDELTGRPIILAEQLAPYQVRQ